MLLNARHFDVPRCCQSVVSMIHNFFQKRVPASVLIAVP